MRGFSSRNLKYMRAFAEAYADRAFVQGVLAQLPWYHNITLLDKVRKTEEREWYVRRSIERGWSRSMLVHQIEGRLCRRQGKAITNFQRTLPAPQSDRAQELTKDPYIFDFLTLAGEARERDLERGLLGHLRDFLIELGVGFAFVGSQYHLNVGGRDFYIDLLFYHLRLRSFVVIELKTADFKPEYAGKMNFLLSAVDASLRQPHDNPSIGIIMCKAKKRVIVEYSLRDAGKPIGVSAYKLTRLLPVKLKGALPAIEDLKKELRHP